LFDLAARGWAIIVPWAEVSEADKEERT